MHFPKEKVTTRAELFGTCTLNLIISNVQNRVQLKDIPTYFLLAIEIPEYEKLPT